MSKGRFTEEQIIGLLKEAQAGPKISVLCRAPGISESIPAAETGISMFIIADLPGDPDRKEDDRIEGVRESIAGKE
jgi:hypothetical protein